MSSTSASSHIPLNPITRSQQPRIYDFVIDNHVIHGGEKGLHPELLFWVAKNPNDPYAKQLIDENPDDLERIRALGANIQPIKKDINIYAQTPALTAALEEYAGCTEEEIAEIDSEKTRSNKDIPLEHSKIMLKDLEDIKNRDIFIIPENINSSYNYTDSLIDSSIRQAQITQNEDLLEQVLSEGLDMQLLDPSEVLGGMLPDETDYEAIHRASLGWGIACHMIRREVQAEGNDPETAVSFVANIKPTYAFDKQTSKRLDYVAESADLRSPLTRLVMSDGKPRDAILKMRWKDNDEGFKTFERHTATLRAKTTTTTSTTTSRLSFLGNFRACIGGAKSTN